ncbi:MAG: glutamate synthase subunit beta [Planctomycetota bacterium]
MGKPTGFQEYDRHPMPARDPLVRISDFHEIYARHEDHVLKEQGARCMDCGVPFCHADTGCPIDNLIPEWNDLVYHDRWQDAYERLAKTNNFPEWTGRICPAPCESACVLGINEPAVTIKSIECAIIDRAFDEGWVQPNPPANRTGKKIAIVGSGPAGLAAADQLNKAGHLVTVFERDDRIGGLLMYGVPNMKLDKGIVQRRVDLLAAEGVEFRTNCNVGGGPSAHGTAMNAEVIDPADLQRDFDAVLLACGALNPRDLNSLPGRELAGVHVAMEYLHPTTKSLLDSNLTDGDFINAEGKDVVVIGGGDTGTDCIGTAIRQNCKSITNITRREREPDERDEDHPWPGPSGTFYVDYGHAEGAAKFDRDPREYGILPKAFLDETGDGHVTHVEIERLHWTKQDGKWNAAPTGNIEKFPADLVFMAIGFTGHDTPTLVKQFGVEADAPGSGGGAVKADYGEFATSVDGVFVAGDMRRGASLIVWAIAEGRGAARKIDEYLMGSSELPAPGMTTQLTSSAG